MRQYAPPPNRLTKTCILETHLLHIVVIVDLYILVFSTSHGSVHLDIIHSLIMVLNPNDFGVIIFPSTVLLRRPSCNILTTYGIGLCILAFYVLAIFKVIGGQVLDRDSTHP